MEKQNLTNEEYLKTELEEIREIEEEVSRILTHKNPFVRFFLFGKAKRLHIKAEKRIRALTYPYALPSKYDL